MVWLPSAPSVLSLGASNRYGFNDFRQWTPTTGHRPNDRLSLTLMFIGGCGFSTAGGLKIFRLFHLRNCRSFFSSVKRRELSTQTKKEITSTLIIVALFPVISAITGLQLAEIEDVSYQDAFFEAAGVITTGGLSAGVIDSDTDPATKIVLGFLMIFGRLEIIAIIYIFVPRLS